MNRSVCILFVAILLIGGVVYIGAYSIDGDDLYYTEEIKYNTDPFNYDTDNDGLSDSFEVKNGYNPRKKTILLTIHSDEQVNSTTKEYMKKVQEEFVEAPVDNPNGTQGINLHIEYKRIDNLEQSTVSMDEYEKEIMSETFDKKGEGYYNILIVDTVCADGECSVSGVSNHYHSGSIVQRSDSRKMAETMMHELGHMIGITSGSYEGVDSYSKTKEEYPSVMNYNKPNKLRYTTEPFNDWNKIEEKLPYKTNTSEVDNLVVSKYKDSIYAIQMATEYPHKTHSVVYMYMFTKSYQHPNTQIFNIIQVLLLLILIGIIKRCN